MKLAEDGSGDVIIRMYESKKAGVTAQIRMDFGAFGLSISGAALCDMTEQERETLSVKDKKVSLEFKAFEIKSLRVKLCRE